MSSELGCSKSSFYWYFKNRNEYIARMVKHWGEISTQQVILSSSVAEKAEDLFVRIGMVPAAAEQKSRILYHYYLGWYERYKHEQIGDEELHRHIGMLREQLLRI
ncbi:hypothetical protein [Paenibacillus tianjinensis]|uniref:Transcriptional regulator, TetR family n=1 Tax=Paenibacillus tianjinensis TaxID=2810347 RepID=A0ABX7LA74_9BACL|nr:hypothetical protein [Paenibacillus tianjinensis]QSF45053.1 hypothetical protein JRJ22_28640 [Paenibacillus tianjinensis]